MALPKKLCQFYRSDFRWCEFAMGMFLFIYAVGNEIWPASPFKMGFQEPLLRMAPESFWDGVIIADSLMQMILVVRNRIVGRYVGIVCTTFIALLLLASMFQTGHSYPARVALMGGITILGFIGTEKQMKYVVPEWLVQLFCVSRRGVR